MSAEDGTERLTEVVVGDGTGVVGQTITALIDLAPGSPLVQGMWHRVRSGGTFEDVVDELGAYGFSSLPSLVVAAWTSDSCRLVLRGDVVVEVLDGDGAVVQELVGADVHSWTESTLSVAHSIRLSLTSGEATGRDGYVVSDGIIPARSLHTFVPPEPKPASAESVEQVREVDDVRDAEPATSLERDEPTPSDPLLEEIVETETAAPDPIGPEPEPAAPESTELEPQAESKFELESSESVEPESDAPAGELVAKALEQEADVLDPEVSEADSQDVAPDRKRPVDAPSRWIGAGPDTIRPEPTSASYLADIAKAAPAATAGAPPPPPFPPPPDPQPASTPALPPAASGSATLLPPPPVPVSQLPPPVGPPVGAAVPPPVDDYDRLFGATELRSVEGAAIRSSDADASPPDSASHDAASPPVDSDHDGMTVSLQDLLGAESPPEPVLDEDSIARLAVRCVSGHLNPAFGAVCRVCGTDIQTQKPFEVTEIQLGRFRFSTGLDVPVVRSMLIGRSPKLSGALRGQVPELVTVPSPEQDISRTHVEVLVDGWQVMVTDRDSTNGTFITMPGRDAQRLRAHEPFPLPVGATVSLAGEVEFTFEVPA